MSIKCWLRGIYYNVWLWKHFVAKGLIASGHDWEFTGATHDDHWEMECKTCGQLAGSEMGPDAEVEEI